MRRSISPRSPASRFTCALPASIFEKFKSWFTSRSKRCALVDMDCNRGRGSCSRPSSSDSSGPRINISGVRSSWLTPEKNLVLASSSDLSATLATSICMRIRRLSRRVRSTAPAAHTVSAAVPDRKKNGIIAAR